MRVSKCSEAASKPTLKELSYEEMCKEEGVYRLAGYDSAEMSLRLVVLMNSVNTVVLWYNDSVLLPAKASVCRGWRFVKVDAEVCFQIKEKHA